MSATRRAAPFLLLLALGWLLVACGDDETPAPFNVDEAAQLVCSEACAAHGQCGTLADDRRAILANDARPAVRDHDRFFLQNTLVTVVEVSPRELVAARDGVPQLAVATPFPHTFYRVAGDGKTAWVSEWCMARP